MTRDEASTEKIDAVLDLVRESLKARIAKHNKGKFVSRAEAMGILVEEYHETVDALRSNDLTKFLDEMMDVVVTGIWTHISLNNTMQEKK